MALDPLRLPRLQQGLAIVDPKSGRPSAAFVRYWNVELLTGLERAVNAVIDVQNELIQAQADIVATQDDLAAAVLQIQQILGIVNASNTTIQAALVAANNAQATADDALGGGSVSDSAEDPAVNVPAGFGWVPGPQVDLTAVVAGDLTITGSGPLQDGDVAIDGVDPLAPRYFSGEFRIMEIVGMVETLKFTGLMSAYQSGDNAPATISNDSAADVSSFSLASTSTGAVSYRMDFQSTGGTTLSSLKGYIFARREA